MTSYNVFTHVNTLGKRKPRRKRTGNNSIQKLEDADFQNFKNFEDYAHVADKYWNCDVYPNTVMPFVAHHSPLIKIYRQSNKIDLIDCGLLFAREVLQDFNQAERFLFSSPFSKKKLPEKQAQFLKEWNDYCIKIIGDNEEKNIHASWLDDRTKTKLFLKKIVQQSKHYAWERTGYDKKDSELNEFLLKIEFHNKFSKFLSQTRKMIMIGKKASDFL